MKCHGAAGRASSSSLPAGDGGVSRAAPHVGHVPSRSVGGLQNLAHSSHHGTRLDQANLSPPLSIFIGSEGAGLPEALMAEMDQVLAIPHLPQVESLNAGVAASIVLYEAARQRQ